MSANQNPLVVQIDLTILLEVDSPRYEEARAFLARCAELVKMPEQVHTYRLTQISLWNACYLGLTSTELLSWLADFAMNPISKVVKTKIDDIMGRFGAVRLLHEEGRLVMQLNNAKLAGEFSQTPVISSCFTAKLDETSFEIKPEARGELKRTLVTCGWPVLDLADFEAGEPLNCRWRERSLEGKPFAPRDYQTAAVHHFQEAGAGVVVLPCGAGKTLVGLGAMIAAGTHTLILVTNITSVRQWMREALDKTTLQESDIGEYSGACKQLRPVTVATYQMLQNKSAKNPDADFNLWEAWPWGLIIFDEVHLLPATLFQAATAMQGKRRLGLTATLLREDGAERSVYALIGPKIYEVPWRELEGQGWIAPAVCTELRVPLSESHFITYIRAANKDKAKIAADNPNKHAVVEALLERHSQDQLLLIGTYIEQLKAVADALGIPCLDGSSSQKSRDLWFGKFRRGEIRALAVSKIANFSLDLPEASVAIQLSGQFGSRQEEAQRLGRLLRPKAGGGRAYFYTIVSRETVEQDYALRRQMFLCEQGYEYDLHLLNNPDDPIPALKDAIQQNNSASTNTPSVVLQRY